jgi:hypothetical protein
MIYSIYNRKACEDQNLTNFSESLNKTFEEYVHEENMDFLIWFEKAVVFAFRRHDQRNNTNFLQDSKKEFQLIRDEIICMKKENEKMRSEIECLKNGMNKEKKDNLKFNKNTSCIII